VTREEFVVVAAYLASAADKPMPRDQAEVYFDLLRDLPVVAVQEAARRAVAENQYPTIPPVGVLRALALRLARPEALGWGEAWGAVMKAVRRYGSGRERDALASLPAAAARAAHCLGWEALCAANPQDCNTLRAQFRDVYADVAEKEEFAARAPLPAPARAAAELVGRPVPRIGGTP
jgi:hypothetical protein